MWRVGSKHRYNRSATRDSPWTATVRRIHSTTDNTFTKSTTFTTTYTQTTLYTTCPPTHHTQVLAGMEACIQDAKTWLCDNGLVNNDNKSQAIVIRSSSLRTPTLLSSVSVWGQVVDISLRYTGPGTNH